MMTTAMGGFLIILGVISAGCLVILVLMMNDVYGLIRAIAIKLGAIGDK